MLTLQRSWFNSYSVSVLSVVRAPQLPLLVQPLVALTIPLSP